MSERWAEGRIALVTGATSGFGEAMTRRLVAGGAKVIATGRRADRLAALAAELGEQVLTRELDVRSAASVDALLPSLPAEFEAIDVLYNNAGLALGLGKAHEASLDDWTTMIDTNVTGLVRMTRAVLPGMAETEFSVVRFKGDEGAAGKVYQGVHAMSADDVALVCEQVLRLPAHINVNTLELMPVQQAFSPFAVDRG